MTMQEAMAVAVKMSNANQIIINEDSYIVRRVGDWSATLRHDMLRLGYAVEQRVKGEFRTTKVFTRLDEAVEWLNSLTANKLESL